MLRNNVANSLRSTWTRDDGLAYRVSSRQFRVGILAQICLPDRSLDHLWAELYMLVGVIELHLSSLSYLLRLISEEGCLLSRHTEVPSRNHLLNYHHSYHHRKKTNALRIRILLQPRLVRALSPRKIMKKVLFQVARNCLSLALFSVF